jgi:hypothetical protein
MGTDMDYEILVVSKRARCLQESLESTHLLIDVTHTSPDPTWRKLSASYPHESGVPVPGRGDALSYSVEGIWQGL